METLFLKVLNMSITAGWVILAVLVLRWLLRRMPKWIPCMLWSFVAFRLLCPVSVESVLSLIPSAQTAPPEILYSEQPSIQSGVAAIDRVVNPVIRENFAPVRETGRNPMELLTTAASRIWLAGICVSLFYAAYSIWKVRRMTKAAVCMEGNVWLCDRISSPFLFGLFCPRIYLPSQMAQEEMPYVLGHERAHLQRGDHFWKALAYLILSVYWFHPLCWAAYLFFCRDMELACDERAVKSYSTQERKDYARILLAYSAGARQASVCPLAFGEVGVKSRIQSVLHGKKPAFWAVLTALLLCVAVGVCFLTDPGKRSEANGGEPGTGMMAENSSGQESGKGPESGMPGGSGSGQESGKGPEGGMPGGSGFGQENGNGTEGGTPGGSGFGQENGNGTEGGMPGSSAGQENGQETGGAVSWEKVLSEGEILTLEPGKSVQLPWPYDPTFGRDRAATICERVQEELLGYPEYYIVTMDNTPGFFTYYFYVLSGEKAVCVGVSSGWGENEYYRRDLDGDGKKELICNQTYGDGGRLVSIFREENGKLRQGYMDYTKLDLPDFVDGGVFAHTERYDPQSERFLFAYQTQDGEKQVECNLFEYDDFTNFGPLITDEESLRLIRAIYSGR